MIALLVGVAALLPWVVERAVGRLGAGKVAWQLAVRRLQLDPGGPARAVSGITVAVAGAIALQMVFTGIQDEFKRDTGADPAARRSTRSSTTAAARPRARRHAGVGARLRPPGVRSASALAQYDVGRDPSGRTRRSPSPRARRCARSPASRAAATATSSSRARAEARARVRSDGLDVPAAARAGAHARRPDRPRAQRRVRHAVRRPRPRARPSRTCSPIVRTDPAGPTRTSTSATPRPRSTRASQVQELRRTRTDAQFAQLRRAMLIGASIVIGLIGLSLLLTALEQLRERRRLLAVLVAFGTRRSTLSWSLLWQSAVPVALGIAIAVSAGVALGAVLLRILGTACGSRGSTSPRWRRRRRGRLLVTAASLPVLWRTMRPEGLRTE